MHHTAFLSIVRRTAVLTLAIAGAVTLRLAHATDAGKYPDRPIRIVVAFGPGGGTDALARMLGEKLSTALGQPVVIDNKPGAGGSIGSAFVAKAPADGYTLELATSSTHGINPALYKDLRYDVLTDFAPISMVGTTPMLMAVPASLPVKKVSDLVELARSSPGKLNYASPGNGTTSHLSGVAFGKQSNIDVIHVAHSSTGRALTDLLAGRASFMFDNISSVKPHLVAGTLRPIAVTSPKRSPILPEVPTLSETGLPGFNILGWFALVAPAGTPGPILAALSSQVDTIVATPEFRARMLGLGVEPFTTSPEKTRQFIEAELPKWRRIVESAGASIN